MPSLRRLIRKAEYRLYLKSPGWKETKRLRKGLKCKYCKVTFPLELHHVEYVWHNRHPVLRYFIPNLDDRMKTLCRYHHEMERKR